MTHDRESNPQDGKGAPGGSGGSTGASADLAGIGLQFALTVVVFVLGGVWLDKRLGTSPWLLILGVLVGAGWGDVLHVPPSQGRYGPRTGTAPAVKAVGLYLLAAAAIIAVTGLLAGLVFSHPGDHRAIELSATVAFGVQAIAFVLLRVLRARNPWVGWGTGSLLRFGGLAVYAVLLVEVFTVPLAPALVTYWVFVFFTMLIEPLLLRI